MKKIIILSLMILACMTASSFAAEMSGSDLWSGFYVGGNIGYGWAIDDATGYISSPSPAPFAFLGLPAAYKSSTNPAGLIGGAQVGYDWQPWPRWLLGAVADFQSSGQRDTDNFNIPFTITAIGVPVGTGNLAISNEEKLRWFGTVRGKIGYAFWNSVLLYGTGGFAYGRVDSSMSVSSTATLFGATATTQQVFSGSKIKYGWAVGGGLQGTILNDPHWSWNLEYLYIDLGSTDYAFSNINFDAFTISSKIRDSIVRIGLQYRFN